MNKTKGKIGWVTAVSLVVASMVGTGAFTSLGLQLEEVQNTWTILSLWAVGALISLSGAMSYAELSTHIPRSGGEYRFLSVMIHPAAGYLSGWISFTVGFAAAIALAAMAMGAYTSKFLVMGPLTVAVIVIVILSSVHSFSLRQSSFFQIFFTALKVTVVLVLAVAGLVTLEDNPAVRWDASWQQEILEPGFAVALVVALYAFSGWNAAAYIVEEIHKPVVNIPRALIGGTILVGLLYLLLNLAFLRQASLDELQGRVEIGQIVAGKLLGPSGGQWISFIIAFLLLSNISAMIWIGPRVLRAMAEDYALWRFLVRDSPRGIPVGAIWLQSVISIAMLLTGSFEGILVYSGFVLQLSTTLAVVCALGLRRQRRAEPVYRSALYPLPQAVYLVSSIWLLVYLVIDRPVESLFGLANLFAGVMLYLLDRPVSHSS